MDAVQNRAIRHISPLESLSFRREVSVYFIATFIVDAQPELFPSFLPFRFPLVQPGGLPSNSPSPFNFSPVASLILTLHFPPTSRLRNALPTHVFSSAYISKLLKSNIIRFCLADEEPQVFFGRYYTHEKSSNVHAKCI